MNREASAEIFFAGENSHPLGSLNNQAYTMIKPKIIISISRNAVSFWAESDTPLRNKIMTSRTTIAAIQKAIKSFRIVWLARHEHPHPRSSGADPFVNGV